MRRYWVAQDRIAADQVVLDQEVFHHIFAVCRQELGSKFEILDGRGQALLVEVVQLGKKSAIAQILGRRVIQTLPKPHLVLALSVPRLPVFEAVIEKSVELGIFRIQPFFSEFSFIKTAGSWPSQKRSRWDKIIISATQQCGRGELMELAAAQPLESLLQSFNRQPDRMGIFSYEGETTLRLQDVLQKPLAKQSSELWFFVGSEGGFSQQEVKMFEANGMPAVSLGEQVLRVETACIALASILKYECIP